VPWPGTVRGWCQGFPLLCDVVEDSLSKNLPVGPDFLANISALVNKLSLWAVCIVPVFRHFQAADAAEKVCVDHLAITVSQAWVLFEDGVRGFH
jgi:hypothetical protein